MVQLFTFRQNLHVRCYLKKKSNDVFCALLSKDDVFSWDSESFLLDFGQVMSGYFSLVICLIFSNF